MPQRPADQQPDAHEQITELREAAEHYTAERYPVQHATARFHLGVALIQAGELDEAVTSLKRATELFPLDGMPVEHAKSTNMMGVALREQGRPEAAEEAFARAADTFAEQEQQIEEAAARFNRGLVLSYLGRSDDAERAFGSALQTFREADAREQASAAARELGAVLFHDGRLDDAAEALDEAIDLARRGGGRAALGAAANVLGLVHLAADRVEDAREAFEDAAGAHPPSVRPDGYALARANLALACEQAGDHDQARLAARQALDVGAAVPQAAAGQAQEILERLGDDPDALIRVVDEVDEEHRGGIVRAEVRRLVRTDPEERGRHVEAWVAGHLARDGGGVALAETWLDVLLELPTEAMEAMIEATVLAAEGHDDGAAFRQDISRAMARFHVPQWMRLKDTFNRFAEEHGHEPSWG